MAAGWCPESVPSQGCGAALVGAGAGGLCAPSQPSGGRGWGSGTTMSSHERPMGLGWGGFYLERPVVPEGQACAQFRKAEPDECAGLGLGPGQVHPGIGSPLAEGHPGPWDSGGAGKA